MTRPWSCPLIFVALAVLLGVPYSFRPRESVDPHALRLVVITPHNEQIRFEFGRGFDRWHRERFGQGVVIDWRTPGGTSEIRRQLVAEYTAALRAGEIRDGSMSYDLLFGGGSYEHSLIARPDAVVQAENVPHPATTSISQPIEFSPEQLDEWYGENRIGRGYLYDPDLHWFGTALAAFGIVYNRDIFRDRRLPEPTTWADLTDPRLAGWIALADPSFSGAITTAFEVILQRLGWAEGWRVLREAAANSRYFADSSSKVPIDVGLGEAAAGMAIDFYGRTQASWVRAADGTERLVYVDPPGLTDIDADPISLLRGGPNLTVAIRFIEFCLSEEGQALWQFPLRQLEEDLESPRSENVGFGPVRFELRRLPVRRVMYEKHFHRFIDKVHPFDLAEPFDRWDPDYRTFIAPLFSSMAVDAHHELRAAWRVIREAPPGHPHLPEMRRLLHEMPNVTLLDGRTLSLADPASLAAIRADWRSEEGRLTLKQDRDRIRWTNFFRANYRRIVELGRSSR